MDCLDMHMDGLLVVARHVCGGLGAGAVGGTFTYAVCTGVGEHGHWHDLIPVRGGDV